MVDDLVQRLGRRLRNCRHGRPPSGSATGEETP
jgi:hypothetical protein